MCGLFDLYNIKYCLLFFFNVPTLMWLACHGLSLIYIYIYVLYNISSLGM